MENPGQGGSLNHLGVEVADTDTVDAEQTRLAEAGLASIDERDTTCCYARQDKFWVTGAPDGERWEIYTVMEDSPTFWGQDGGQSWDAVEAALDAWPAQQGGRRAAARTPQAAAGVVLRLTGLRPVVTEHAVAAAAGGTAGQRVPGRRGDRLGDRGPAPVAR